MVKADAQAGNSETAISGEVLAKPVQVDGIDEKSLGEITSFDDVLSAFSTEEIKEAGDVLGNGFGVLDDKNRLLNVEFVVVKYAVHPSEKNGESFSTLHVVTLDGQKLIVNDGSTGIHAQCVELKEKYGNVAPLRVKRGLRVSEYDYTNDKGVTSKAKTYYLNTGK